MKVIRFTNRRIDTNFFEVCKYIDATVEGSLRRGALALYNFHISSLAQRLYVTKLSCKESFVR